MPRSALSDKAAELLQSFGFLVFHQRPCRVGGEGRESWASAVDYDGEGFPDLIARRPNAPTIAIEVKDTGSLSEDQKDWRDAWQGDGSYYCVLTPRTWDAFEKHLQLMVDTYEAPPAWPNKLASRQYRIQMRRAKKRIAKKIAREGKVPAIVSTELRIPHNTPLRLKGHHGVWLYRGHASNGTICVYGPVIWDGSREKWVVKPKSYAKFRCFDVEDYTTNVEKDKKR